MLWHRAMPTCEYPHCWSTSCGNVKLASVFPLCRRDSLGELRVWSLQDLRPLAIRRLHPLNAGILSLRLFKSGSQQLLATQGRDGTLLLWLCSDDLQLSE
jgi:hypothetical protein